MDLHNINDSFFLPDHSFFTQTIGYIETKYHGHSFYEILYVISGEITHIINGRSEKLVTGDIVFLRPGDYHMFTDEHSENFLHTDILIKTSLFKKATDFISHPSIEKLLNDDSPCKLRLSSSELAIIEKELQLIEFTSEGDRQASSALQLSFLTYLLSFVIKNSLHEQTVPRPLWIKQLLSLFQSGAALSKTKEEIYSILNTLSYNRSYISRAFKKYVGKNLTDYINDLRFSTAYNLLCSTNQSIDEIIQTIGLTNKSYFYREFQKRFNTSPGKIRIKNVTAKS